MNNKLDYQAYRKLKFFAITAISGDFSRAAIFPDNSLDFQAETIKIGCFGYSTKALLGQGTGQYPT